MKVIRSGTVIALLGISCSAAMSMALDPLAPLGAPPQPAPAPVKPVTETIWGKQVTDRDRYMETLDGKVAAGISQGGSEAASIFVYDAATGQQIAGPLDRADPGFVTWSDDSRS
jgi:hypothetical protein